MSDCPALLWLARAALGGGGVLLFAWWRMRHVESPARRQRLGEWALAAALLLALLSLAPGWIGVPLPSPAAAVPAFVDEVPPDFAHLDPFEPLAEAALPQEISVVPEAAPIDWGLLARFLVAAYAAAAGAMLLWLLLGHLALWRLLRSRIRPSPRLGNLWRELAGCRRARLLVSPRVRVPFSCGVILPTVVVPASLDATASDAELRWVLRHELRHLERGDALSAALFGVGQVVFFFLPWFWWLRREVRLCQEYLADQAAVEASDRVEYAGFLAGWAEVPALPAGASAVAGDGCDLIRRIRMLLRKGVSLEARCPRAWLLGVGGGLVALAVVLAGVGPAALAQDRREEKKDEKEKPRDEARRGDAEELAKRLQAEVEERQKQLRELQMRAALQAEQTRRQQAASRGPGDVRLGLMLSVPTPSLIEQLDLPKGTGLLIDDVVKDSPAAKAGLKVNDILLEVAGKPVSDKAEALQAQVRALAADKAFEVVVLRKGKKEKLEGLTLPEAKADRRDPNVVRPDRRAESLSMLAIQRSGEQFTFTSREGTRMIQGRGKLVNGKAESVVVMVGEGRDVKTYDGIDKVPAEVRDAVKALVAACETKTTFEEKKGEKEKPADRR